MVLELNQGPVGGRTPSAGSVSTPKVERTKQLPQIVQQVAPQVLHTDHLPNVSEIEEPQAQIEASRQIVTVTDEPDIDEDGQEVVFHIPEENLQGYLQRY
jgi:hypothetical protein